LFDPAFANNWKKELKSMNKCKVGRRFDFPDSFIEFPRFIIGGTTHATGQWKETSKLFQSSFRLSSTCVSHKSRVGILRLTRWKACRLLFARSRLPFES